MSPTIDTDTIYREFEIACYFNHRVEQFCHTPWSGGLTLRYQTPPLVLKRKGRSRVQSDYDDLVSGVKLLMMGTGMSTLHIPGQAKGGF